jgi:hypothetical protein
VWDFIDTEQYCERLFMYLQTVAQEQYKPNPFEKEVSFFYLCTVHVVTFTLLEKNQLMHLFQHFHIHIKTPEDC